jgi:hypothetical protein
MTEPHEIIERIDEQGQSHPRGFHGVKETESSNPSPTWKERHTGLLPGSIKV